MGGSSHDFEVKSIQMWLRHLQFGANTITTKLGATQRDEPKEEKGVRECWEYDKWGLIGGMGAQLRVPEVAVRCGGGVYGAATRHASPAAAVGWRCRTRRGWRPIQKPPAQPTSISLLAPLFPAVPHTDSVSGLSPPPPSLSSDLHLLFLPPLSLSLLACAKICFFFSLEEAERRSLRRSGGGRTWGGRRS